MHEPRSRMDTYSIVFISKLLKIFNNHINILLITHFMDEADFLRDRISIMSEG